MGKKTNRAALFLTQYQGVAAELSSLSFLACFVWGHTVAAGLPHLAQAS